VRRRASRHEYGLGRLYHRHGQETPEMDFQARVSTALSFCLETGIVQRLSLFGRLGGMWAHLRLVYYFLVFLKGLREYGHGRRGKRWDLMGWVWISFAGCSSTGHE
jgi:hypothetical protein